ncbi:hypothetical protein RND81_09G260700 [Saponaria officinalis]|uniref:Uncharacterized protein n=1 Tax=Saponaria officinalis TaxID=3572 RepID=A0AAW1IS66_SAPOF
MAKSFIVSSLAILLIFSLIASTEIQTAEAKDCGWVYKKSCFKDCDKYCGDHWGAKYGKCKWYNGEKACFCYYGECHH